MTLVDIEVCGQGLDWGGSGMDYRQGTEAVVNVCEERESSVMDHPCNGSLRLHSDLFESVVIWLRYFKTATAVITRRIFGQRGGLVLLFHVPVQLIYCWL